MDGGNGRELDTLQTTPDGDGGLKSSNDSVGEGHFSGTDVDSVSAVLARNLNLRGSLTAADRPRPASGMERGSNVGSRSHHFVGSKKPTFYADVGYVKPHHSHANVNISTQAVNNQDGEPAKQGDLSTVESSKSDTELLSVQDMEVMTTDDSLTTLGGLLAKAVTLASASEVVRQSIPSDPVFASHLNKCNSSSKTYEAGMAEAGMSSGVRGHGSLDVLMKQSSAVGIKGERRAGTTEGKRSSHNMLGRIKILTSCLSSSDEGRSREDMTASSEGSTKRGRIAKINKKRKTKKRKKMSSEEEVDKDNSENKINSGTEVGKAITGVDKTATGKEAVASPIGAEVVMATTGMEIGKVTFETVNAEEAHGKEVDEDTNVTEMEPGSVHIGNGTGDDKGAAGMEVVKDGSTSRETSKEGSPVFVIEEIKASSDEEASAAVHPESDQQSSRSQEAGPALDAQSLIDEMQQGGTKSSLAAGHSGSSIELLCEYGEHVDGDEPVLSAVVTPCGQTSPSTQPTQAIEVSPKQKTLGASDLKQVRHHASAPLTLNQEEASQPEIALKAVKERYRVLSERISDVIPSVTLDDNLRLAVLGSFSYAAERGEHPELTGRRAASSPGPLEHMAQYLVEEFSKDNQTESGIASFDGTYYDESFNHQPETPKAKQDSGSSSGSGRLSSYSQNQDQEAKLTSSSDSSQDDYVQQMEQAQPLIDAHQTKSPTPDQRHPSSSETEQSDGSKDAADLKGSPQDPDIKLIVNDYSQSLRKIKGGHLGSSTPSLTSSGYGSSLQAKIAEIEANLSISEGLRKPYKVEIPVEQDSVRKKELAYILKMLQNDTGTGQGEEHHRDPSLLEAAVRYLYWSRHDAQDLLRKPQQHQKVVMEDKLETKNLQLDLPPRSGLKGNETLEQLKVELELRLKQIEDAIAKTQESGLTHHAAFARGTPDPLATAEEGETRGAAKTQEIIRNVADHHPANLTPTSAEVVRSSGSDSSEDSRPPSSFHYDGSVAVMSPGAALGSGILVAECERARKVRQEMQGKVAELERQKEELTSQMKDQRLTSVQLEAHLLSQTTTLTKEYQSLMAHDQELQHLSQELRLKLDKTQKELEQAKAHLDPDGTRSDQLIRDQLASVSFQSKETIHQLSVRLAAAEQKSLELESRLRQESARQEALRGTSRRREEAAGKERETLTEELRQERRKSSQLGADLASQSKDLHRLADALQEREDENRSQAEEIRGLKRVLDASHRERMELKQELELANQKLATKHEQWKQQRQELKDHLGEARASLTTSQLHLQTLSHTNRTLTGTTAQLQQRYQDLSSQLHKERLARETTGHDLNRIKEELEAERKSRSNLVTSQLSRWQQNLQHNTHKLSDALKNKICNQQLELRRLRDITTELNADLQSDNRSFVPLISGPCRQPTRSEAGTSTDQCTHVPRQHQAMHFTDWTRVDTGGSVGVTTTQDGDDQHQHKRC